MAKKSTDKKGKKVHKNKPSSKKYSKYSVQNGKVTRSAHCPRCGPGIFLNQSLGRKYCGKCHYTEFEGKKI
ncbi:30S ribosomal protein S27ae [Candidatus Pacearchaeota archaeon CG10_big_fil_rev_8_21_14_0_10_34_76]|nr:MAG: 30S ribosomal protein S27ae [Candidatus Pacearchaeota archaeon CG10_big_fil_rev_8_21_14_0_10_34_76]